MVRYRLQEYLIFLCFALLCLKDNHIFYRLKVRGNPVLNKSICAIFLTAFAHFLSLYHILVILTIFQTFINNRTDWKIVSSI